LGGELTRRVSRLCRESIRWALEHRDETINALLEHESRSGLALDRATLDRYLTMYANADTLDAPEDVRRAIDELYARAYRAGWLAGETRAEFAE
jgi:1,4-dihydroxy-6-naphthoate synthase